MIHTYLILFFCLLALLASGASLLKHDDWWIRVFDFPRVQIVAFNLMAFAAFLFIFETSYNWHFLVVFLLTASLVYQIKEIYPYTTLARRQVKKTKREAPNKHISMMVANVLTPNRQAHKLMRLIEKKNPDLVLTVESDIWWEQQLSPLEKEYPYAVKQPQDNLYGMHLYSKLKLIDPQVKFLVESDIPSIHTEVTLHSGEKVKLFCLHPTPPSPTENSTSTERDAELLLVGKHVSKLHDSVIVIGDMNDVAWSRTTQLFQKISGLLDPRKGRGFFGTFHAKYPLMRWPLDHVFHSNDFTLVSLKRMPYFGSDHFPIFIHLNLEPKMEKHQPEPEADEEEKEWAEEKIENADAEDVKLKH